MSSGGAIALINSFGALGSFVGAYGVGLLNGATGNPGMSFLLMAAALIASAAIMFFMPEKQRPDYFLRLGRGRGQRAFHENGDGGVAGRGLGAVIMHALDQVGDHRAGRERHRVVVGVVDIAAQETHQVPDKHHRIARRVVIVRPAEVSSDASGSVPGRGRAFGIADNPGDVVVGPFSSIAI